MTLIKVKEEKEVTKVVVEGHTEYEDEGKDILCASLSTALNMTINVLDNLGYNIMNYKDKPGYTEFSVKRDDTVDKVIKSFKEIVGVLEEDHPENVKIVK